MEHPPTFYTKEQFAKLLKVSTRTVERAVLKGTVKAVRIGRHLRFSSLEAQRLAEPRQ